MGVKVAVTGGSGFLAAHLIHRLMANPTVDEIRTIDRKQFKQRRIAAECSSSSAFDSVPTIVHFQCDLLDSSELEKVLAGVDVVFHLARKAFEYLFVVDQKTLNDRYSRDNLEATQSLLNAIFKCSVPRMVHVGDAFANVPPGDNFGSSEHIHRGLPSKYLLGHYGETRAKAELIGREKSGQILPNGRHFHALFLRPTFVYGEGEKRLPMALKLVAERHGEINEFAGPSNGMLQYIYAGNLASIMVESMELLLSEEQATRLSGTFFYCMDDTVCTKFGKFCAPLVHALGHRMGPPIASQWATLFKQFIEQQIRCWCGWEVTGGGGDFSATALRFLFSWAIGFSDRTMALILKYRSDRDGMVGWTKRTTDWIQREMAGEGRKTGEAGEVQQQQKREEHLTGRGGETMRRMG